MNGKAGQARRYHWHSEGLRDFVDEPHAAIDGMSQGTIINLTDRRASASRSRQLELIHRGPDTVIAALEKIDKKSKPAQLTLPHLTMPARHDVRAGDVMLRRLHGTLTAAANRGPVDFSELLLTPGVGARTVQSPGNDRRGCSRRAVPISGSCAFLLGARRKGSPSISRADQGLR
jgi:hypothetical protein